MGEKFDNRLEEIKKIKTYSKQKQRALDDLATAYLQPDKPLDQSLHDVHKLKKALRATGYTTQQIEDFLIERSYISKASLRRYYHESIYNEDMSIKQQVECIPVFHTDMSLTDLIIDELKSRPKLLNALQKKTSRQNIEQNYKVNNGTLLIDFYNSHKDIIDN